MTRSGSDDVVVFRFAGPRRGQPQVPELQAEGLPGDPQQEGGLLEIAARVLHHARQQEPVQLPVRLRVEVTYVGLDPLLDDERLLVGLDPTRRRRGCSAGPSQRFRQEGREQDGAAGLEQGLFQDALQLPNVARPRVAAQPLQPLGGDLADLPPEFAVEAAQVVLHQHQQVIVPLPQWGQVDGEDAQAVIQVRPELPLLRPRLQVAVGRRDQPHVSADRLVAADALEGLLLEHAQHLGLGGRRHVADLVEEEGAAVALLELADAAAVGAGEGALLVAEQLALQQVLGDGGAVQRQERRLGAGAVLVDGTGDQFLARAALAGDQHGECLVGDSADRLVRFLHPRAVADDGLARELIVGRRLRDDGRLAHQPGNFERLADHAVQLLQINRLEQVVVRPVPHRLDGRVGRPGHGDHDHRDAGVDSPELPQDVQAGLVGQAQVEENNVRASGGDPFQALCGRLGDFNPVRGAGNTWLTRSRSRSGSSSIRSKVAMRREPPRNCKILKLRWSLYQSGTKQSVP